MITYQIIPVEGQITEHEVDWPHPPSYRQLKILIEPLLGPREPMEHVYVRHKGQLTDMFVSELGHVSLTHRLPLPINPRATVIYQNNSLTQNPHEDRDSLPTIAGQAILFHQRVWF